MVNKRTRFGLIVAVALTSPVNVAVAEEQGKDPFRLHMQHMLTTDDEWRTPNPDYEPGTRQPKEYALQLRIQPDGHHALGELMGVYDDGKRVTYWTLFAMYNPVTEKVVTQQVGWNGALVYGENDLQYGGSETMDAITYNVDGSMRMVRHVNRYAGAESHESDVYERNADGEWSLQQQWTWHRVPGAAPGTAAGEHAPGAIDRFAGYLVSGSGQWRTPNPDHEPGAGSDAAYGMNFSWGPRKQYISGEIVSIAEDGSVSKDWSIYIIHNPVTGKAHLYQTGPSGVYFQGELRTSGDGRHSQMGLVFLPNGTVKSVRDEVQVTDENTQMTRTFERDAEGSWSKLREWEWKQVAEGVSVRD